MTALVAAAPDLPDLDLLALEYVQLERHAADLQRRHERVIERLSAFPSLFTAQEERTLAAELDAAIARMRQIDAQLLPLRRVR
jgi:hypothetical protein